VNSRFVCNPVLFRKLEIRNFPARKIGLGLSLGGALIAGLSLYSVHLTAIVKSLLWWTCEEESLDDGLILALREVQE
jgi:hypothetical protein